MAQTRPDGLEARLVGLQWLEAHAAAWIDALQGLRPTFDLDMSKATFVDFSTWTTIVSALDRMLRQKAPESVSLTLFGEFEPMPSVDDLRLAKAQGITLGPELQRREVVQRLARFINDIGTFRALEESDRVRIHLPFVDRRALKSGRYSAEDGDHTLIYGLSRIAGSSDCARFSDKAEINLWRQAMGSRFKYSALFDAEELWRVICHELATNIVDHAGAPGFVSVRVVENPLTAAGELRHWCQSSFGNLPGAVLALIRKGFVEINVSDSGRGIVATLGEAFRERFKSTGAAVEPSLILQFALDEFGTRKTDDDSWATESHALARVLHMVERYGGTLRVASAGIAHSYDALGERFERAPDHCGYKPTRTEKWPDWIPGTHLQLLIALETPKEWERGRRSKRRAALQRQLPSVFYQQPDKVKGHLVPLRTYFRSNHPPADATERREFFDTCQELVVDLIQRTRLDPIVFDFSDLPWNESHIETFLVRAQNIVHHRPCLLVEIDVATADRLMEVDRNRSSSGLVSEDSTTTAEQDGMEPYSRIGVPVIAIDAAGRPFVFGLRNPQAVAALSELLFSPSRVETLSRPGLSVPQLRRILNSASTAFEVDAKAVWRCVWNEDDLSVEAARSIERHFDRVAESNGAWRGRALRSNADGRPRINVVPKYHLAWRNEWREDFLDLSQILARTRHADEVAQRLLYRLSIGLTARRYTFEQVTALACVSAPGLQLATCLYRWWPSPERPAVIDLGYYTLFHRLDELPAIAFGGSVVIIEDLIDSTDSTRELIESLRRKRHHVCGVLSFVRFGKPGSRVRSTSAEAVWTVEEDEIAGTPCHWLIEVPRPRTCEPPRVGENDEYSFLIERRSLRPVRYPTLRRDLPPGRDPDLDRRDQSIEMFDSSRHGCLLNAGHFVYGPRHYSVSVNIRSTLLSEVGDQVVEWLADVCEGDSSRDRAGWEPTRSSQFAGDVSIVLMPLHSQVHYLWPFVERVLNRRNRRQPMWLLDDTIFTGRGPEYLIPPQLLYQMQNASRDRGNAGLRILVVDDAAASGRTAETIVSTLLRTAQLLKERPGAGHSPIEWIRYHVAVNQMDSPQNRLWSSMPAVGEDRIPFLFTSSAPFMGVKVYDANSCPSCQTLERVRRLRGVAEERFADQALPWTTERTGELQARAVDSLGVNSSPPRLSRPLSVLVPRTGRPHRPSSFMAFHADTAIWRFRELMYLAYPPTDVLAGMKNAWPNDSDSVKDRIQLERYRQAVIEWCLSNWGRVEAAGAAPALIDAVRAEFAFGSAIASAALEACATRLKYMAVRELIVELIARLEALEASRMDDDADQVEDERARRCVDLYTALTLVLLQAAPDELETPAGDTSILTALKDASDRVAPLGTTFLRTLFLTLTRSTSR